jgi:hypothetical protein
MAVERGRQLRLPDKLKARTMGDHGAGRTAQKAALVIKH